MMSLTHIVIGMIMAVPFALFFKNRLYIVAGAIGGVIPDVDLLPFFQHRGFMHSPWLWLLVMSVVIFTFLVIFLNNNRKQNEKLIQLMMLIFTVMIAWVVHLFLDFSFTDVPFYDLYGNTIIVGGSMALTHDQLMWIDTFIAVPILLLFLFGLASLGTVTMLHKKKPIRSYKKLAGLPNPFYKMRKRIF